MIQHNYSTTKFECIVNEISLKRVSLNYRSLSLLFLISFFSQHLFAQTWDVGGFIGGTSYMGDLNPINPAKVNNLAFGAQVKRCFNPYWALKLGLMHGTIEAKDANAKDAFAKQRNLSFYSPVTEISLQTEFNFFSYVPSISKKWYTPYLFAGLGFVGFNPKAELGGTVYELRTIGTEGQDPSHPYKNYAVSVPFGLGFKYNFTGKWSLIAEAGYRTVYSDYLDDVSNNYLTEEQLLGYGDEQFQSIRKRLSDRSMYGTAEYGSQRGDYRSRDSYMFVGLSVTYSFFKRGCPVVAY